MLLKPYKSHLSTIINNWKLHGNVTYTKIGNPRIPIQLVHEALDLIIVDQVQKAARICGFDDNYKNWYITKHGSIGSQFEKLWLEQEQRIPQQLADFINDEEKEQNGDLGALEEDDDD